MSDKGSNPDKTLSVVTHVDPNEQQEEGGHTLPAATPTTPAQEPPAAVEPAAEEEKSEEEFSERDGGEVMDTHEIEVEVAPAAALPHPEQTSAFKDVDAHEAEPVKEPQANLNKSTSDSTGVFNGDVCKENETPEDDGEEEGGHTRMAFGDDQGDEPTPEDYQPTNKWWSLSLENVFNLVQLDDAGVGLDKEDVPRHGAELGDNVIPVSGGAKWYVILAKQFMNAITVVLLIVVVISGVFKDWAEFGVVLFILFFNAALGFYQEFGAEKSLQSLKQMTAGEAKVLRNDVPEIVFINEVVVGGCDHP
ncbi:Cation transporter/ATPase, N-terminus, putative [Angomonas deanei]|uniref:Cation transporter/ATPase, N-terminus, putative n=1 Tax=Angomonas deanei TaxID=59799 RepID=A0A7G2CAF3_9TRYP|nr:Cation transporter/ATPase, N-terminus, putative [Angomonas deanei]